MVQDRFYRIEYVIRVEDKDIGDILYSKGTNALDAFDRAKELLPGEVKYKNGYLCTEKLLRKLYPETPAYSTGNWPDYYLLLTSVTENMNSQGE